MDEGKGFKKGEKRRQREVLLVIVQQPEEL